MTRDKGNFIDLENYVGGSIKFAEEDAASIYSKGTIVIDGKHKTDDVYYVKGLRHNILSVSQMCQKGYKVISHGFRCEIKNGSSRRLVTKGTIIDGNVYM